MEDGERFRQEIARRGGFVDPILRLGLGVVILLAGAHKLVAPTVWSVYVAPPFESLPLLSWTEAMVANGVLEVAFGALLLADRYTFVAATIVALSLVGVAVDLAVLIVLTGEGADVLIRDLGLLVLAAGVAVNAAAHQ